MLLDGHISLRMEVSKKHGRNAGLPDEGYSLKHTDFQ